eukprot:TRINITY_DN262_c1_g1_i1.p1 TRINITY_DN262_c1_g1~~TRINITY_DN262_c1_g1_i1.p1  ORF type:complete len:331 (-),score=42.52 TRINITY_DN262_c1_g1_i1:181-1077(-)
MTVKPNHNMEPSKPSSANKTASSSSSSPSSSAPPSSTATPAPNVDKTMKQIPSPAPKALEKIWEENQVRTCIGMSVYRRESSGWEKPSRDAFPMCIGLRYTTKKTGQLPRPDLVGDKSPRTGSRPELAISFGKTMSIVRTVESERERRDFLFQSQTIGYVLLWESAKKTSAAATSAGISKPEVTNLASESKQQQSQAPTVSSFTSSSSTRSARPVAIHHHQQQQQQQQSQVSPADRMNKAAGKVNIAAGNIFSTLQDPEFYSRTVDRLSTAGYKLSDTLKRSVEDYFPADNNGSSKRQ